MFIHIPFVRVLMLQVWCVHVYPVRAYDVKWLLFVHDAIYVEIMMAWYVFVFIPACTF